MVKQSLFGLLAALSIANAFNLKPTASTTPITCSTYTCGSNKKFATPSQCALQQDTSSFIIRQCDADFECIPNDAEIQYCTPWAYPKNRLPGEFCASNNDCIAVSGNMVGSCLNYVCQGVQVNEACQEDIECAPGLYCDLSKNICSTALSTGIPCERDAECNSSDLCYKQKTGGSICQPYLSLDAGSYISGCQASNYNNLACKSGICTGDDAQDNGQCVGVLTVQSQAACKMDSECPATDINGQTVMYGACACSYNAEGEAHCQVGPGNQQGSDYLKFLTNFISSGNITKCPNTNKLSPLCVKAAAGNQEYQEYLHQIAKTQNWSVLGYNEECYLRAVYPEIFTTGDYDDEDDFAEKLQLLLGFLLILA